MKFNIDNYKGNYAMHCKTKEEAEDFCKFLDSIGKYWNSGASYAGATCYDAYEDKTCYDFNAGKYSSISWYITGNYKILEWSNFMNKEFTKSDLKSGDVVLRRRGDVEIVCLETGTLIRKTDGWNELSDINEDLTHKPYRDYSMSDCDIVAVRRPVKPGDCRFSAFDEKAGELVYDRGEEMTLEEVCKELGREIKIVKSK